MGKIVLEGDPKTLPGQHGAETLDDLFVTVAHEALARESRDEPLARRRHRAAGSSTSIAAARSASFPIFVWVAVDILLWGFLTRYLNSVSRAEVNFVPTLLGAVLLWDFLTRVMQGVTMAFFEDVWTRNFLNIFATPLRTSEYLTGIILVAVCTSLLSLVAMVVFARLAFGLSFLTYGAALAPFLAVLFLTGIAFGVAAAALVLRLGPASEWLIWPIPMIVSPFAGVFYPVAVLPVWMRAIATAAAAILRVRGHAGGRQRRGRAVGQARARRRPCARLPGPRLPRLHGRLPHRHPHRPHRPLQRRDGELRTDWSARPTGNSHTSSHRGDPSPALLGRWRDPRTEIRGAGWGVGRSFGLSRFARTSPRSVHRGVPVFLTPVGAARRASRGRSCLARRR